MTRFPNVFTNTQSVLATWDAWNRLTRLASTADVTLAVYSYDGDWKRLKKTVGSAVSEYYYDDMQLAEVRTNGVASEQFVYDTRYLHSVALRDRDTDGDGDCVDSGGSERLFYCNDGNFNVTALVATNGAVVERYTYDPYGKATIRDANWQPITWDASRKNVCLYTGHKFDAESGLYYSIYRYYHPGLGRWATRDPVLTFAVETALATPGIRYSRTDALRKEQRTAEVVLFPYLFAQNKPNSVTDPNGLWVQSGCATDSSEINNGSCVDCLGNACTIRRASWWPWSYVGACMDVSIGPSATPGGPPELFICTCCIYEKDKCEYDKSRCLWCDKLKTRCVDTRNGRFDYLKGKDAEEWGRCAWTKTQCEKKEYIPEDKVRNCCSEVKKKK